MKISFKQGRENKIHIMLDGEYRMTADRDFIALSGIVNNSEISEEELAELTESVNSRRAFNKACELLSRRDHSRKELFEKLKQKGFADGAEEAIDRLCELGYLDDRRFAQSYASELVRLKKFGKRRIKDELFRKGVDREIIDEVLDEIEFDKSELVSIIERKYMRNLGDEKGVKKTVAALMRMGYSFSEIKDALNTVASCDELSQEDF